MAILAKTASNVFNAVVSGLTLLCSSPPLVSFISCHLWQTHTHTALLLNWLCVILMQLPFLMFPLSWLVYLHVCLCACRTRGRASDSGAEAKENRCSNSSLQCFVSLSLHLPVQTASGRSSSKWVQFADDSHTTVVDDNDLGDTLWITFRAYWSRLIWIWESHKGKTNSLTLPAPFDGSQWTTDC